MSSEVTGPVVTPDLLESLIERTEYHKFQGTTTVACALTLINGATLTGMAQCAPTTVFDGNAGMHYSREDALNQLAQLAGILVWDAVNGNVVAARVGQAVLALKEHKNGGH